MLTLSSCSAVSCGMPQSCRSRNHFLGEWLSVSYSEKVTESDTAAGEMIRTQWSPNQGRTLFEQSECV